MFFLPSCCLATNYNYTFGLLDHPDGSTEHWLTISVTSSLYEYYRTKDHSVHSYDFAKFVTPNPLKPVADDLWTIYDNNEDFANGVLMFVHQIPYVESGPQKYPIETIVENEGDCDLFSFVAASIMKAGGLDVVLLLYQTEDHMNVGVHLSHEPNDARFDVYYYSHEGKRYYVAECTGDNWKSGWRVGECPNLFRGASARIITLEDCEQSSPGQISSSYKTLDASSLSVSVSKRFTITGNAVTIKGYISPALSSKNITLYISSTSSPLNAIATVVTGSDGQYSHAWRPTSWGQYSIRASWSGDADYAGADSNTCTLTVIPFELLIIGVIMIVLLVVLLFVTLTTRGKPPEELEPFDMKQ